MKVHVVGGGGHGKTVIEALRAGGHDVVGVIDDGRGAHVLGIPVVARPADGPIVNGVGMLPGRAKVFDDLRAAGHTLPPVVHPDATVDSSVTIADGTHVLAQAYIGASSTVGFGTIVNAGAIVNHDCVLGELVHVAPGAVLSGGVRVGDRTTVGPGAAVHIDVRIGTGVLIAMGAVVKVDVPDGGHVKAGQVWG